MTTDINYDDVPDWAIEEALKRAGCEHWRVGQARSYSAQGWVAARATMLAASLIAELSAEREMADRLAEENRILRQAHWFYLGDDCSSENCRFDIHECISEDFEWDNKPEGNHVLQISGARQVPDMWVALHYFTESEKDEREDDEEYAFTVHETEEAAKSALAAHEATR